MTKQPTGEKKHAARRKRRQEYHHGDLRRALIAAALQVIDEEGVSAVTTRALARRLGVSHAAPGHHFRDREALLTEVATEGFRRFAEVLEAVASREENPRRRVVEIGLGYVGFAAEHPAYFRVMFGRGVLEPRPPEGPLRSEAERSFQVLRGAVAVLLDGAGGPAQVDELSFAAWSLVHGLAMLWIDGAARAVYPNRAHFEAATERVLRRAVDGFFSVD